MRQSIMSEDELPYLEESSEALGQSAAKNWQFRFDPAEKPTQVLLEGACPKCGHPFPYAWPLVVMRANLLSLPRRPSPKEPLTIAVICGCSIKHPGAADGERGCGRHWSLIVPSP